MAEDRRPRRDFEPRNGRNSGDSRGPKSFGKPGSDKPRPKWEERVGSREDFANKPKSPLVPEAITAMDLPMPLRAQLKTLTAENAEETARHLVMVRMLGETDPELALAHAKAAASRAGRIAFIRETLGVVAYAAGEYTLALRELLAHRRATGSNDQLPLIVDSERGLGRPQRAIDEGKAVDRSKLEPSVRVNLAIALSGARLDLGQNELALVELEIKELDPANVFEYSVPLFWAYSDTLEVLGREAEAKKWAELATRAEAHFFAEPEGEQEAISILEEVELPDA